MATQHQNLAVDVVTNLTTELTLADGVDYLLQAFGGTVYLLEAAVADAPADTTVAAHRIVDGETWVVGQGADQVYVWGNAQSRGHGGLDAYSWSKRRWYRRRRWRRRRWRRFSAGRCLTCGIRCSQKHGLHTR